MSRNWRETNPLLISSLRLAAVLRSDEVLKENFTYNNTLPLDLMDVLDHMTILVPTSAHFLLLRLRLALCYLNPRTDFAWSS